MRAKRLEFIKKEAGYWVAESAIGDWVVFRASERGMYRVHRYPALCTLLTVGDLFKTSDEAQAACQQEFDRIWLEMTDTGEST
jgi:hypothetical protein